MAAGDTLTGTSRQLFDAAAGDFVDATVIDRDDVKTGKSVTGPAAITEAETTVIVPSGFVATAQPDGCIEVTRLKEQAS